MRLPPTALLATVLILSACTTPTTTETSGSVTFAMDDPNSTQVQEFANATWTTLTLNLGLGSTPKDVYLAFTNRGTSATRTKPTVAADERGTVDSASADVSTELASKTTGAATNDIAFATRLPKVNRTSQAVAQSRSLSLSTAAGSTTATPSHAEGSSGQSFRYITYDEALVSTQTFTLATQVTNTAQNRIVNVWVDSALFGATYSAGSKITSTMTGLLAAKFLASGTATGSDIYSWDTGIFGREYYEPGTTVAGDLVTPTGEINIVLADLNPNRAHQSSYVYGYFWAANNFNSYTSFQGYAGTEASNANISFYLDGPLFASLTTAETTAGTAWSIADDYPADLVSTLAHEFQHMIQFYQKQLRQGLGDTDTWINEMCSMEAEDLLAAKLGVTGPRGVPLSAGSFDYSTGALASNDRTNRIALFNRYYPTLALTGSPDYSVEDYSMAYSFGSWLARNYGGAPLFRALVQNNGTDYNAVVSAVNAVNGTSTTWPQLLRRWAASVVTSTEAMPPPRALQVAPPYYFSSTLTSAVTSDSITFGLGSIDYTKFYAYRASASETLTEGPILSSRFTNLSSVPASGLYLLKPLLGATGTRTLTISLPASVDVTVVTKVSS